VEAPQASALRLHNRALGELLIERIGLHGLSSGQWSVVGGQWSVVSGQ
jgi:hypothetical protein